MRASDLAAPFPTVEFSTTGLAAARLLAGQDLPGLIVVDEDGRPSTILAGTKVLQMAIPTYCQDDPTLARVIEESAADVFLRGVAERTVRELLLPRPMPNLSVVEAGATLLEVAAEMAASGIPLVAVTDAGNLLGAITLDALMDRLVAT